jgi:hypothetical protein
MQDALTAAPAVRPPARRAIAPLLRVTLAETLRRGRTSDGVETHPLRQVLFASTMLGVFSALPLRLQEPGYWVRMLFLYTAVYIGLGILPDSTEAFERRRDILGPLPLRRFDAAVARLCFLAVLIVLLVVPLALPSLVWIGWRGALGWGRLAGLLVAMLLLGLAMTGSWLFVMVQLGKRFGVDRVRRMSSVALSMLVALAAVAGAWSWMTRGLVLPPAFAAGALAALPSSWFAAPFLSPAGEGWREGLGALALFAAALVLATRTDFTTAYVADRKASKPPRDGWACACLAAAERRRGMARASLLPLVLFLSRIWSRDPFSSMRVRAFVISIVALFGLGWWKHDLTVLPIAAAVLGFMALADGTLDLAMSADAGAAWLLQSAPVGAERMIAGLRATVLCGRLALPAVVLGTVVGHADGIAAGLTLALAFCGVGYLMVSTLLALRPRAPFAQQSSTARGSTAVWLASPLALVAMLALSPAFFVAKLATGFAVLGGVIYAVSLYAFGRALGILAARRYARRLATG